MLNPICSSSMYKNRIYIFGRFFLEREMDFFLRFGDGFVNMEQPRRVILSWWTGSMFVIILDDAFH